MDLDTGQKRTLISLLPETMSTVSLFSKELEIVLPSIGSGYQYKNPGLKESQRTGICNYKINENTHTRSLSILLGHLSANP